MNAISPLSGAFAITIYLIAFLTAYLINLKRKRKRATHHVETIDGLRGFLALGVFIHHAHIWYFYIHEGSWHSPASNLYNQFGQTSVSLFFMITSFLFVSKLLNSKEKPFDWTYFFISRITRLAPMYYVSILLLVLVVLQLSRWQIRVSTFEAIKECFHWAAFTITTTPMINDFQQTTLINAGVVWSLPWEWLFYFSLPLLSLFILKVWPKPFFLLISLTFVVGYGVAHGLQLSHLLSFGGGAIAPFLLRYRKFCLFAGSTYGSMVILLCLFLITLFPTAEYIACKLSITVLFTLIASGNDLFGVLNNKTVKFLGEMAYSTYLLHGIILFVTLYMGFGLDAAKQLSEEAFALLVFGLTPIVVLASYLGYQYVEKPGMERARKIREYFPPHTWKWKSQK